MFMFGAQENQKENFYIDDLAEACIMLTILRKIYEKMTENK